MKSNRTSFLFFVGFIFCLFFATTSVYGQVEMDSVTYYQELVKNSNTVDDLRKANTFFRKKIDGIEKDNPFVLYHKYDVASIEKKIGNYIESENLLVYILDNIEQFESSELRDYYQKSSFILLGNIYRDLKNKEKSIELYDRALQKAKIAKDSVVILNNKSNIYKDFEEYENSEKDLLTAYNLLPKLTDSIEIARVFDNLGFAYSKLRKLKGLEFLKKGLELREKLNDKKGLYSSYKQLAIHYKDYQNNSLAELYAMKAFNMSKEVNTPSFREDALGLLVEFSNYSYAKEYKRLNDSISDIKTLEENKFAIYRYDKSESEKRTLESELNNVIEKRRTLIYKFLGGIILVIAIFFIIIQRNRNKRHTIQQVHKTEKELSKKVHDELGNDIFYLMNQIQYNPAFLLEKEGLKVLNDLNDIYIKARDISKKYTNIDTGIGYKDELLNLLNSFGNATTKIVTNEITVAFWESVTPISKEQLYRILQELFTNMKKHSEASLVAVTFTKYKRYIVVKYVDNGKGAVATHISKNGLRNVENRIDEMKGTITFDTNPNEGFKVEIRFVA
ncbi:Sensor histidine kinase ComP [Kordia antarctica]|uniref:histidine kinase n=1 Tax=Kordia antarctica TaxID=1218801 RepID=A0A7L4ZLN1_9FLAO|nr:ATP-binding protein [Kordia antarctica]QHI37086.1 Sensor histidine kinase ComP [Kordia antarctica]